MVAQALGVSGGGCRRVQFLAREMIKGDKDAAPDGCNEDKDGDLKQSGHGVDDNRHGNPE
jgi:hypothetical protein